MCTRGLSSCQLPSGDSIAIMSTVSPLDALRGAQRPGPKTAVLPRLLLAGATGPLGNEVLSRVVGAQNYGLVQVLAREPYVQGLRGMELLPQTERPVRALHVARLVEAALLKAPPGIHVAPPELVWRSAQKDALGAELQSWLGPS